MQTDLALSADGYSQEQIAGFLGIDQTSVRDRLAIAEKRLQNYFGGASPKCAPSGDNRA